MLAFSLHLRTSREAVIIPTYRSCVSLDRDRSLRVTVDSAADHILLKARRDRRVSRASLVVDVIVQCPPCQTVLYTMDTFIMRYGVITDWKGKLVLSYRVKYGVNYVVLELIVNTLTTNDPCFERRVYDTRTTTVMSAYCLMTSISWSFTPKARSPRRL